MSYSQKRKLGRRKVEAAAGVLGSLHQRLSLMENILSKLLEREGLVLGNITDKGFDLVPAPPPAPSTPPQSELEVTYPDAEASAEPPPSRGYTLDCGCMFTASNDLYPCLAHDVEAK